MASKADIEAGKAFVTLYTKNGPLEKGVRSATKTLGTIGRGLVATGAGLTAVGAAIAAPLTAAVKHFMDAGDEIEKLSKRTGLAAQNLAELRYAANQSDVAITDLERAMRQMVMNGISPARFDELAEEIRAIEDPTRRATRAMEVFGTRSGVTLMPLLLSLRELRQEARNVGVFITDEEADRAAKLGDAFQRMRDTFYSVVFRIGAALEPMITSILTVVQKIAIGVGEWVKRNEKLAQVFAIVGAALLAIGPIVAGLGTTILLIAAALGGLPVILTAIKGISLTVVGIVAAIAVAIASMAYWARRFVKDTEIGRRAWEFVKDTTKKVLADFKEMGKVLVDIFSSGDIEAAFKVVTTSMSIEWHKLMVQILEGIAMAEQAWMALQGNPGISVSAMRALTERGKLIEAIKERGKAIGQLAMARRRMEAGNQDDPSQPGYGLPERRSAVVGTNFRAALMGRQVIGTPPTLKELKIQSKLQEEARNLLRNIDRKIRPVIAR